MSTAEIWTQHRRDGAQRVITRLLAECGERGWEMKFQNEFDFRVLEAWSSSRHLPDVDVMKVLAGMHAAHETTIAQFEAAHVGLQTARRALARDSSQEWTFHIPLKLTLPVDQIVPIRIQLIGKLLELSDWRTLIERIGKDKLERTISRQSKDKFDPNDTCLSISTRAPSASEAWRIVEPAFDTFRGLVEVTFSFGQSNFSSEPRARRKLPHPLWMVASNPTTEIEPFRFFTDEDPKANRLELKPSDLENIEQNLAEHRNEPAAKSIDGLLVDTLRLYSQAMDARHNHQVFLNFWQLAEAITLADRHQGNKKVVCHRLSWLFKQLTECHAEGLEDVLDLLYEKRCKLVHHGIHHDVFDDDVNFLKFCCEVGINWLHANIQKLPTQNHLDFVFNWATANRQNIAVIRDVVAFVTELQTKGAESLDSADEARK